MVGETATYTCDNGYQLSGSFTVTCQTSGSWDTIPTCLGIIICMHACNKLYKYHIAAVCGSPPSISNGSTGTPTSVIQGGTVIYSCNSGYQLSGSATAVCQDSGNWSPRPTCLGINSAIYRLLLYFCHP